MIFEIGIAFIALILIYKKKIKNLIHISIRLPFLLFLSFLIQFLVVFLGGKEVNFILRFGPLFYVMSFLLLLSVLYQNSHIKGMKIIFLGIFINLLAITMNGGQMPVAPGALNKAGLDTLYETVKSGNYVTHTLMTESDNIIAKIAGDIIPITPPHPRPRVISIGDIVMTIGIIYMLYFYTKNDVSE